MSDDKPIIKAGPPWKTVFSTSAYVDANEHRNKLLEGWKSNNVKDMQVKVKWLPSKGQFTVRTRADPSSVPSVSKKKGKSKKGKDNS